MQWVLKHIGDAFLFVLQVEAGLRPTTLGLRLRPLIGGSFVQETRETSLQIVHDLLLFAGCLIQIYFADKHGQRGTFDSLVPPRKVADHCYS